MGFFSKVTTHPTEEIAMDTTAILVIVLLLLFLGGGWYGRGRWY